MTAYTGSNSADYLYSGNWNYNWDSFYMYNGNDTVIAPTTTRALTFYGHDGNDYFSGSYGNDVAYGGNHNDTLLGNYGKDYLNGGSGNDSLYGGVGNDTLVGDTGNDYLNGGAGQDSLYGGKSSGYDTFRVLQGDSNAAGNTADIIADWNPIYDNIDSSIRGTSSNYRETATSATNIGAARSQVENSSILKYEDHVFLYNASTNKGYLLSDLDGNYSFETGVIIPGASSSAWMSYSDIV